MPDFIEVYDDALDESLCSEIIDAFERSEQKHPGEIGHGVDTSKKDSVDLVISSLPQWQPICDQVLDETMRRLIDYVRKFKFLVCGALAVTLRDERTGGTFTLSDETFDNLTTTQLGGLLLKLYRPGKLIVQKYEQGRGGYHHWHSEIYPRSADCEELHRVLLFMYYLNTVAEGGETAFYYQDRRIAARRGQMVIAPAGFSHTHKGHIPISGDKYILTSWVKFQRFEAMF